MTLLAILPNLLPAILILYYTSMGSRGHSSGCREHPMGYRRHTVGIPWASRGYPRDIADIPWESRGTSHGIL